MKNVIKFIPILLTFPLLISCGGEVPIVSKVSTYEIGSSTSTKAGRISYKCERCDGKATYRIKVSKSQSLEMKATYTIDYGALTVEVLDSNGEQIYRSIIIEDSENNISLKDYGSYKIVVNLDDFKGTYLFDWQK